MAAITEVSLRNFRGFERLDRMRLAPLTFLVGPNSSGKSSVADAVLFMAQSGFLSLEGTDPIWIGRLVDLGSFKDTVFRHEMNRTVEVRVGVDAEWLAPGRSVRVEPFRVNVVAQLKALKSAPDGRLHRLTVSEPGDRKIGDLQRRAGRHASFVLRHGEKTMEYDPSTTLQKPRELIAKLGRLSLGILAARIQRVSSGRNEPQRAYLRIGTSPGDRPRPILNGVDATALEVQSLREALRTGLLALGIADDLTVSRLNESLTALHLRDNLTGVVSSIAEFGYGASQVLPVLEGLAASGRLPSPLFIEQPEIHLHPRAQGELAQILCNASKKRQLIVETHSEHMINRARRLVAEGKMKAKDVVIQYIDRDENGSHASTIELDDAGDFTRDWPDGFFDERYRETMKIAEAQASRAAE